MKRWLFAAILILAVFFRFNNFNWDDGFHLHPDERFLTMVGLDMTAPNFFVYGTFPLNLNKNLAALLGNDNYNDFTVQGRQLSALVDLLVVILVFKIGELLEKKHRMAPSLKYWAAFFYAVAVYPIQAAHFFTVDTFLNFFMLGSFYFALRKKIVASAIFFGLAASSKASAIFILPLVLFLLLKPSLKQIIKTVALFLVVSYVVVHLASPNYFQSINLLNPTISAGFINSIKQLKAFEGKDVWYPPGVQWIDKPATFVLANLALVGVGLPVFIFMLLGFYNILRRYKDLALKAMALWTAGYLLYLSLEFVKSIRYTIFLYPFFAILAGAGAALVIDRIKRAKRLAMAAVVGLALIWPLVFSTIYFYRHTRVEASEWIYDNLPGGSYVLSEYWDDSLPLPVEETHGKTFFGEQLPVFDPDTSEKWVKIEEALARGNYYVLSSNRAWGSIKGVPEKYPQTSQFYRDLLENKNPRYKKIKEFTPYYYRFFRLPDWVEETFTVYDHPTVIILKNNTTR